MPCDPVSRADPRRPLPSRRGAFVLAVMLLAGLGAGCGDRADDPSAYTDPARVAGRMLGTLEDLAALGNKRAGTDAGIQAGNYVHDRFRAAGLSDVRFEEFTFPRYDLRETTLAVTVDGGARPMAVEAFAYSGVGRAEGDVVFVGTGRPAEYEGIDAAGKVVLLLRDALYHRSAQYLEVVAHGGVAMFYVSQAPENLIQIGTVADPEDGPGPIPSVAVGKEDGERVVADVRAGRSVHAVVQVDAEVQLATGRNVVGRLPGSSPTGEYLLVGAHYDTWYAGSADNGTGVAAVLELAEAMARRRGRRLDLVFIAYDGEELGLFGGYDYLRRHVVVDEEPMLGWVNFEIPGAGPGGFRGLGRTNAEPIVEALESTGTSTIYNAHLPMEVVPSVFGGLIPTDIQGMYWWGLHGFSTACDSPYYHTVQDTPDKIDVPFLADAALHFESAIESIDLAPTGPFRERDPFVWRVVDQRRETAAGLEVELLVTDAAGQPQPGAFLRLWLDVDDFSRVWRGDGTTDASGKARLLVPSAALARGAGDRWLHATAGVTHPLVEWIAPLP